MKWAMQVARQAPDAQSGAADGILESTAEPDVAGEASETSDEQAPQPPAPEPEPEPESKPEDAAPAADDEASLADLVSDLKRRVTWLEGKLKHMI
jgi:hypothetical protein